MSVIKDPILVQQQSLPTAAVRQTPPQPQNQQGAPFFRPLVSLIGVLPRVCIVLSKYNKNYTAVMKNKVKANAGHICMNLQIEQIPPTYRMPRTLVGKIQQCLYSTQGLFPFSLHIQKVEVSTTNVYEDIHNKFMPARFNTALKNFTLQIKKKLGLAAPHA